MFRYLLLLSFVVGFLFPPQSFGDSINVTAGVGSKHYLPYKLNEDNGGVGIGYQYDYNEDIAINVDYLKFTNSYNVPTNFIGLTGSYNPFSYQDYKLGVFGGVVHNDGYCGFYNVCRNNEKTTDYLPIGGAMIQLDNLIIKGMALPNTNTNKVDAIVWSISLKAMEF